MRTTTVVVLLLNSVGNDTTSIERLSESFCRWSARADDIDSYCREEVKRWLSEERDEVEHCYIRSDEGRIQQTFFQCMYMRNVSIPTPYSLTMPEVTQTAEARQNQ